MAKTLLLDRGAWDLCVDTARNIAVASEPYSQVQDAASACRLFAGEAYYDTSKGVPYFASILGKLPPLSLVKSKLSAAALTVPGVTSATVYLSAIAPRMRGQIQIKTASGSQSVPF